MGTERAEAWLPTGQRQPLHASLHLFRNGDLTIAGQLRQRVLPGAP